MDAASEGDVPWALLVARLTAVTAFVAAMLLRRAPLAVRSVQLTSIASIGALIVGADSMYAISSTLSLLSVVAVLSSLYPVVTVVLARVYLRERIERLQQIGITACLSGVAAISGATGDGVAEFHPHEAKRQQVAVVGIQERLAVGDQKGLIQRAWGHRRGSDRPFPYSGPPMRTPQTRTAQPKLCGTGLRPPRPTGEAMEG